MASSTVSLFLLLSLFAVAVAAETAPPDRAVPATGLVGGRTEIKDASTNKLVQSLGKFAVATHNRRLRHGLGGTASDPVPVKLAFSAVAAAQKQVVSGVAYYLKVIARDAAGGRNGDRPFDAVVVVKEWQKPKEELVSFTPSPK